MKLIVLKNNQPIDEVQVEVSDLEERYEIYVGRADDCHVFIDDPLISRHHFVIRNEGDEWTCEKLTQLGHVAVNGNSANKNKLADGDEIKCGLYSVMVVDLPKKRSEIQLDPVQILKAAAEIYQAPSQPVAVSPAVVSEPEPILEEAQEKTQLIVDESGLEEHLDEDNAFVGDQSFNSGESTESSESSESIDFSDGEENDSSSFSDGESHELSGLDVEDSSDEGTRVFKAFVNYQLVLFGEHAPYDRFLIDIEEIFVGRDTKKCQIILDDPEVSSVHAAIRRNGNDVTLEDLNSSNGTILNGERINKAHVNAGDDFVIGSTTFTLEVKSDLLDIESDRLMPVESGQVIETEEIIEEEVVSSDDEDLNFNADGPPEKSALKRMWKDPKQRKKLIYGGVLLALILILGGEDETADVPQDAKDKKTAEAKPDEGKTKDGNPKIKLSTEQLNRVQVAYELGVSFFEQAKYFEADKEFQTVIAMDPEYKKVQSYLEQTRLAMKRLEEIDAQKRLEAERLEKKKKIAELMEKAKEATKERKVAVAEQLFAQIAEMDPENMEVSQLKLELEEWKRAEESKALAEAAKIAARKKMVDALAPGKTSYLKKEWYRAILKLEEFMRIKGMDEDLVKEGSDMLADAKNQLSSELGPLLGKARSLKEGQDYKNAYEAYLDILKVEPTNSEALNEVDEIKSQLENRSRKIYREAIIAESLSLFNDAKEKFQEVQQISPTDSEYYRKASDKLKNYME